MENNFFISIQSASSDSGRDQQNYGRIGRWFAQMVYSIWIVHLTVTSFRTPSQFLAKEKFQITSIVMMMVIGLELAPVFALVVVTFIVVKMLYRTTIDGYFKFSFAFHDSIL
jgi:hypothetical protein